MKTKTVLLIDDELAAIKNLSTVINDFNELEIVDCIQDGKSAVTAIEALKPDIVFLDIEMPEMNGFDVAKATSQLNYQLVFVTAYEQYALDAFDTNAIDYLLKPVRPSVLKKCINKILHQQELALEALEQQLPGRDTLALSDGNSTRILKQTHICYIEGIGRYRRIHLTLQGSEVHQISTIISDTTLDEFESQLSKNVFLRLHRSYIVNLNQIMGLVMESRKHLVSLIDIAIKIPVSRSKVNNLKTILSGVPK